jgi:hypothetical protein
MYRIARARLADEREGHVLQPSALVNEAFIRLLATEPVDWTSRAHFYAHAARVMRRILIDIARERDAHKRDGGQRLHLSIFWIWMPLSANWLRCTSARHKWSSCGILGAWKWRKSRRCWVWR